MIFPKEDSKSFILSTDFDDTLLGNDEYFNRTFI